jgi:hypothetical protein
MVDNTVYAICVLRNDELGIKGQIRFTQVGDAPTTIQVDVSGLKQGKHGFHIHEFGKVNVNPQEILVMLASLLDLTITLSDWNTEDPKMKLDMLEI